MADRAEKYSKDVHSTRGRRGDWSEAELAILAAHPDLSTKDLAARLPGRTPQSIGNKRKWFSEDPTKCEGTPTIPDVPASKEPGDYLETLSPLLVDDFDCLDIWLRWNGYATCRELCRDLKVGAFGLVTLLCTAK